MRPLAKTLLLAGLAALIATGVRYGVTAARATETERAVAEGRSRLQALEPLVTEVEEYRQGRETAELKTALIENLRNQSVVPWDLLDGLVDAPPAGLTLEGVSAHGSTVEISGRAGSLDEVARWVQRLQVAGGLEELDLRSFEASRSGGGQRDEFTLVGRLPRGIESEPGS
jgi:Tfp pilus assembly protein PilN